MTRTAQAKLLILLVFVVGMVTGGLLIDIYQARVRGDDSRRETGRDSVNTRFEDYLRLTEEQRAELRAILERTEEEFDALRAETRPMYRALREQSRANIRAMLTAGQQELYDQWRTEVERRRAAERQEAAAGQSE